MGHLTRVRRTERVHIVENTASKNPAPRARAALAVLASAVTAAAALGFTGCASTSAAPQADRSINEIENERNPIVESDCLEGEYFDSATESCESVDSQK